MLNVLKSIYFVLRKTYHYQRTLNWLCLRWCNFVIKTVWFQLSKFSKVVKIIYNSISDACLVIFAPYLAVESLEFDQNSMQSWQQLVTSFTMANWALISCCREQKFKMSGKFEIKFFWEQFMNSIFICFSKRGGGSYCRWITI